MRVLTLRALLFFSISGEGEEVHAPSGQPEGPRCGEEFHVQQAHILYFQHGVKVSCEIFKLKFLFLKKKPSSAQKMKLLTTITCCRWS